MNRTRRTIGAVAAVLVLAGCGADGDGGDPVPDPSSTSTSSSPTPAGPVSPAPTSPAPSTPLGTISPPTPVPTDPDGGLSLVDSCQAVLDDQQGAVRAVRDYAGSPLDARDRVGDLDRLRSELAAGQLSAPEPLRQELDTQVGVLTSVVQGIRNGTVQRVDLDAFQRASDRITALCDSAGR